MEVRADLKSKTRVRIENRRIKSLAKDPDVPGEAGVLVTLEDGTVSKESFIVSQDDLLYLSSWFNWWAWCICTVLVKARGREEGARVRET